MKEFMLGIFEDELRTQCKIVQIGAEQLEDSLSEKAWAEARPATDKWAALQSILVSAANISKLLWGSGNEKKRAKLEARRKPLRDKIGIDDSSVLNSTSLRNDFEHFDERIEAWFKEPGAHNYIGRAIAPAAAPIMLGPPDQKPPGKFGRFDPETTIVEFWENAANIRDIVQAAGQLHDRLIALGY